jgi:hypothetical protein
MRWHRNYQNAYWYVRIATGRFIKDYWMMKLSKRKELIWANFWDNDIIRQQNCIYFIYFYGKDRDKGKPRKDIG